MLNMYFPRKDGDLEFMKGLSILIQANKSIYFRNLGDCTDYIRFKDKHPFGLSVPQVKPMGTIKIRFVGARRTEMSVECFLVHIRTLVDWMEGCRVTKLRVISIPEVRPINGVVAHVVFFEFWVGLQVIISGQTDDHSTAGNGARGKIESVFAVLSYAYKVPIERVIHNDNPDVFIAKLYEHNSSRSY
jgi:hypothetical protein